MISDLKGHFQPILLQSIHFIRIAKPEITTLTIINAIARAAHFVFEHSSRIWTNSHLRSAIALSIVTSGFLI